MLTDKLKSWPQYLMPGHALSRLTHRLTRCEVSWFKNGAIRHFCRLFQVDMGAAQRQSPHQFRHFNDFFTRELRPESRPIATDIDGLISPVDGSVSQYGPIRQGRMIQAKGRDFSVAELLGESHPINARHYQQGQFITLYLSPRDYHRIHIPLDATLTAMSYIPGRLFSVNPATARTIPKLFARNERVVAHFATPFGKLALIMVGAVNVGSIETLWAGEITPPAGKQIHHWHYVDTPATHFTKGEEIGRFNMGSTVILLLQRARLDWSEGVQSPAARLQMGQLIARFH
ncbi:phosphatidylserine decarboxylase [Ectothiorhodospiraceae bacterium BW-2]|nr:phosphatidylserine decarboxylase [Ectothiorhodospiraceae bacterium BW-2]